VTEPSAASSSGRPTGVAAVIGIGAVATLCGLMACLDYADHLIWLGDSLDRGERIGSTAAESVATVGGRALLVVAETLACALFTALGVVALGLRTRDTLLALSVSVAFAKVIWMIANLGGNWSEAWWFILDPQKKGWSMALVVTSGAQALAWTFAAVSASKRSGHRD
jgi:hypothetical protein